MPSPPAPRDLPTRSMRAIVQRRYGSADTLQLDRIDRPTAGDGEVLVDVRAAGLDRSPRCRWDPGGPLPWAG
jgi:D-arabinose 1-dehydrogenase-like Zn-dependent alcohol dehydrogenase